MLSKQNIEVKKLKNLVVRGVGSDVSKYWLIIVTSSGNTLLQNILH